MEFATERDQCVSRAWLVTVRRRRFHNRQYYYCLRLGAGILDAMEGQPMTGSTAQRLAVYQARYEELASQLTNIGFIAAGTVTHRYTRCTSPGCRCNADPPQPHGPYYQWTAKTDGKTVTRRLTPAEADLYKEWIANDRQLRAIIANMRDVAAQATNLIINTTPTSQNQV